jgi:hypothetical protein
VLAVYLYEKQSLGEMILAPERIFGWSVEMAHAEASRE